MVNVLIEQIKNTITHEKVIQVFCGTLYYIRIFLSERYHAYMQKSFEPAAKLLHRQMYESSETVNEFGKKVKRLTKKLCF